MAAKDAVKNPLVSEGFALIKEYEAAQELRNAKALELKPLDENLRAINDKLEEIKGKLIDFGAGLYSDETGQQTARVVAGIEATLSPDTFRLPDGAENQARALCGDFFPKMFNRRVILEPKPGFDAIADAILTPAKARDVVALCIIPGSLSGGRRASIRWGK